jgi:hypothetical protein
MKGGIRLSVLAVSDTGYVHSIIPNHRKLTGGVGNLTCSEKRFISRTALSLMGKLQLGVSVIEDYNLFTDRYYSIVEFA